MERLTLYRYYSHKSGEFMDPLFIPLWIAIVGGVVALLGAVMNTLTTIFTLKIKFRMTQLEQNTNSMKDELVKITHKAAKAEGNLEGRKELIAESSGGSINDDPSLHE